MDDNKTEYHNLEERINRYLDDCQQLGIDASSHYVLNNFCNLSTISYEVYMHNVEIIRKCFNERNLTVRVIDGFYPYTWISKIRIEGLFKYISYEFDVNKTESIIVAPNGFGKTTLLNLVSFILNPTPESYYNNVEDVPFDKLIIEFEKQKSIVFCNKGNGQYYLKTLKGKKSINLVFKPSPFSKSIRNHDCDVAFSFDTREIIDKEIEKINDFLTQLGIYTNSLFVKASRVYNPIILGFNKDTERFGDIASKLNPIHICANYLLDLMLLFSDDEESKQYLYKRIRLFERLINKKFSESNKRIKYDSKNRFFKCYCEFLNQKNDVNLVNLSTGERSYFLILFNIIFKTINKTIIFIDEPEISLQIEWQEQLIDDIQKCLAGTDCQIIVSTHSSDIITGHVESLVDIRKVASQYEKE